MNILKNLISFLEKRNLNKYAAEIHKLAAPAEPFLAWFGGEERVYLPYKSNVEVNEDELRKRHPYILEAGKYMGFDEGGISLYKKSLDINARSAKRVRIALPFYTKFFEKKLSDILELEDDQLKEEFSTRFLNIFWGSSYLTQIPQMMEEFKDNFSRENFIKIQNELMDAVRNFKDYDSDDLRESSMSKDDKMVVISRAEKDVVNMSTDRRWTSCMDLYGEHAQDIAEKNVYCEVENGGFIAYLTSSDDFEVEDPYSRVLIRRFDSKSTNKSIAIAESIIYGQDDPIFLDIVNSWIKEKQGQIDIDEYKLMGMEYSDEYDGNDIFGIPENISVDELIKNPNSIFNYSDTIFIVKDNLEIPILIEEMQQEAKDMEVFEGFKIFNNKEEVDFLYNYSNDNLSKIKNNILNRVFSKRIESLKDELCDLAENLDNGDYVDLKNTNLVDALIKWSNEEFGDADDLWHKLDSHYEEFIDFINYNSDTLDSLSEQNYDGLTVNKFDQEKPFYGFEFEIKEILEGKKERYESFELPKEKYFDEIYTYKPLVYRSMITSALRFSKENPNGLSKESMKKIKAMKDRAGTSDNYNQLVLRNPDNSDKEDLNNIINTLTESFLSSIKNFALDEKYSSKSFRLDFSDDKISDIKHFLSRSSDKYLVEECEDKFNSGIETLLSSSKPNDEKVDVLLYIIRTLSERNKFYRTTKILIDLNKVYDFISKIKDSSRGWGFKIENLEELIVYSKNLKPENLKRIFEKASYLDIYFEQADGDGNSISSIPFSESVRERKHRILSDSFLDIISEEKNREVLEEEIDFLLHKISGKINQIIKAYKEDIEFAKDDGPEALRYFNKNLKSELDAISKFSKRFLEIIK